MYSYISSPVFSRHAPFTLLLHQTVWLLCRQQALATAVSVQFKCIATLNMSASAPYCSIFLCHCNEILYCVNAADCVWKYNNSETLFLSELLTTLPFCSTLPTKFLTTIPFFSTLPTQLQYRSVLTVSCWISVNISSARQPWRSKYQPQYRERFGIDNYTLFLCVIIVCFLCIGHFCIH
jgi:hypothetical protein